MRLPVPFIPVAIVIRLERRATMRPRWRLRLRTLLALVRVVGLGLAWAVRNVQRARAQPTIIAELRQAGVRVAEWEQDPWGWVSVILSRPLALKELRSRRDPNLFFSPSAFSVPGLSDEKIPYVIERLGQFPNLKWISVGGEGLSPRGQRCCDGPCRTSK
jgi:hypothetical protein